MSTPNTNKSLSDIFDVELSNTDKPLEELKIAAKVESIDSLETQRNYVKTNLISLIEKGIAALDSVTTIANSTEVAKDFVVVSDMIKTLVATNMTLLECEVVHKPVEHIGEAAPGQITNNTSTVFVGSTSELSKFLANAALQNSTTIIENK